MANIQVCGAAVFMQHDVMNPASGTNVITVVSAVVAPDREPDLITGFRDMTSTMADGVLRGALLRSELLRGQQGSWRIESLWRDLDSLQAVRASGQPPAALALFETVGAEPSHTFFFVAESYLA